MSNSGTGDPMLDEVLKIARYVPRAVLEDFCGRLQRLGDAAPAGELAALVASVPLPNIRGGLLAVTEAWQQSGAGSSLLGLAWALRAAAAMNEHHQQLQVLDMGWTGPMPRGARCRRTDQALLELIEETTAELLLVTYTAYRIPEIAKALVRAAGRNVHINLVVESQKAGTVALDALQALGQPVLDVSRVYHWPEAKRPHDGKGNIGAMHAKCAVGDGVRALLSSANLTEFGLADMNMEIGIHINGGPLPAQVLEHFLALAREGILERMST